MGARGSKLGKILFVGGNNIRGGFKRLRGPPNRILTTPKGYVPICVGLEDETKRFMVRTTLLGDSDFLELLYRSAEEYGFCNDGILRIPCGAKDFEDWIITRSKPNLFNFKAVGHTILSAAGVLFLLFWILPQKF